MSICSKEKNRIILNNSISQLRKSQSFDEFSIQTIPRNNKAQKTFNKDQRKILLQKEQKKRENMALIINYIINFMLKDIVVSLDVCSQFHKNKSKEFMTLVEVH